ncbi:Coenzyme F420 hydrogenase/dehydrogenase, beta subunit C-terminal domain [Halpernia frigidisoli]|uniref:Coenzyme F420-reducing hydrogenase, beta subunit n=1 Tax=Halpernia frigidisoli TaxID=1125876 RepID=A0A1I3FEI1_9FLAO|nr:Coenzyme F420 hydrogenase/dehydrogenase, beta subunit C-terminal domain [Halpernia frigidisoli]SFI09643.1 Coenzyme F420-reducing hydrogenase, beta subunit [Halpernia frigidisoli]
MNSSKVIQLVVENNLCIGCGLCVYKCPSDALEMKWNSEGFLVANEIKSCDCEGKCLEVCPFNPFPKDEVKTENEISDLFLKNSPNFHKKIGKYNNIYAGFSEEFRLNSSSGGLGTYILTELLENKIVDHIFSIKETKKSGVFYEYSVSSSKSDLLIASKTRYFPVTLSTVFSKIDNLEGKIAIVGVGCFIKAIRLAQNSDPKLKDKIPFLIGIICGGVKSKFFTEYLASKINIKSENIHNPQFRKKNIESSASDYSFACENEDEVEKSIRMKTVGEMWGTGLFKNNACDFCDDVTTELADISLGDAWMDPFDKDGKGTNVIVTRSLLAENLIKKGIQNKSLKVDFLPLENFLASQEGSFNHRHLGLPARIEIAKKNNQLVPPKRNEKEKVPFDFKLVQKQRIKVRAESLEIWKSNPDAKSFDAAMEKPLKKLKLYTEIYHKRRRLNYLRSRFYEILKERILFKNNPN